LIAPQKSSRLSDADANKNEEGAKILRALVIVPNEKTTDLGSLLAIARSEACKREQVSINPTIKALMFVAELGVYVAIYESTVENLHKQNCTRENAS
jgi:hypothetical protein